MKKVTKKHFYETIYKQNLNVHPTPTGNWPFKMIWKYLGYDKYGQTFGMEENGEYFVNS